MFTSDIAIEMAQITKAPNCQGEPVILELPESTVELIVDVRPSAMQLPEIAETGDVQTTKPFDHRGESDAQKSPGSVNGECRFLLTVSVLQ